MTDSIKVLPFQSVDLAFDTTSHNCLFCWHNTKSNPNSEVYVWKAMENKRIRFGLDVWIWAWFKNLNLFKWNWRFRGKKQPRALGTYSISHEVAFIWFSIFFSLAYAPQCVQTCNRWKFNKKGGSKLKSEITTTISLFETIARASVNNKSDHVFGIKCTRVLVCALMKLFSSGAQSTSCANAWKWKLSVFTSTMEMVFICARVVGRKEKFNVLDVSKSSVDQWHHEWCAFNQRNHKNSFYFSSSSSIPHSVFLVHGWNWAIRLTRA